MLSIGCVNEAHPDFLRRVLETCREQIPLCCVLPAGHPLTAKEEVEDQDLLAENLITCSSYTIPVKAAEYQNQITLHLPPESIHICKNLQIILTLIRSGYGYSILPKFGSSDTGLRFIPLKNTEPLSYGIFYRKGTANPLLKKAAVIAKNCREI